MEMEQIIKAILDELYKNYTGKYHIINDVLRPFEEPTYKLIKGVMRQLNGAGYIEADSSFASLGGRYLGLDGNLDNLSIKAYLTMAGLKYYKENYIEKPTATTSITADNVFYNTGTVSAPVQQVDFRDSDAMNPHIQNIKIAPNATPEKKASLLEKISWAAGIIATIMAGYEFYLHFIKQA